MCGADSPCAFDCPLVVYLLTELAGWHKNASPEACPVCAGGFLLQWHAAANLAFTFARAKLECRRRSCAP